MKTTEFYQGIELRPPSEVASLKLRVTRNCPWNKCKFCGLYRDQKFSIRPLGHIIKDLATIRHYVDIIQKIMGQPSGKDFHSLMAFHSVLPETEQMASARDEIGFPSGRRHLDHQA